MDQVSVVRANVTPLRVIAHPKGDIRHALKASEASFQGFGEAYFTTILPGQTKGWKKHRRMHMNLMVVQGKVAFHVHDDRSGVTETFVLSTDAGSYGRLHVPPGLWMAFGGRSNAPSLVLNLASIEHDPDEAVNVELETYPIGSAA
jgi:dTDP-4-dehydrorhamnose 3,5-epimerase